MLLTQPDARLSQRCEMGTRQTRGVSVETFWAWEGSRSPLGPVRAIAQRRKPGTTLEFLDSGWLGGGSGEADLESGLSGIEEVVGQRKVA